MLSNDTGIDNKYQVIGRKALFAQSIKKVTKLVCNNYCSTSLLCVSYNLHPYYKIRNLEPFTNTIIGEYKEDFRKA